MCKKERAYNYVYVCARAFKYELNARESEGDIHLGLPERYV